MAHRQQAEQRLHEVGGGGGRREQLPQEAATSAWVGKEQHLGLLPLPPSLFTQGASKAGRLEHFCCV